MHKSYITIRDKKALQPAMQQRATTHLEASLEHFVVDQNINNITLPLTVALSPSSSFSLLLNNKSNVPISIIH